MCNNVFNLKNVEHGMKQCVYGYDTEFITAIDNLHKLSHTWDVLKFTQFTNTKARQQELTYYRNYLDEKREARTEYLAEAEAIIQGGTESILNFLRLFLIMKY